MGFCSSVLLDSCSSSPSGRDLGTSCLSGFSGGGLDGGLKLSFSLRPFLLSAAPRCLSLNRSCRTCTS